MSAERLLVAAIATLALVAVVAAPATARPMQAPCHLRGTGAVTAPDDARTPGSCDKLSGEQVCTAKGRDSIPGGVRKRILSSYGLPPMLPFAGEFDHRVPNFLGGRENTLNLWPEPGPRPNPKDRLETYIYGRVCHSRPRAMRPATAIRLFLGDWRVPYKKYIATRAG